MLQTAGFDVLQSFIIIVNYYYAIELTVKDVNLLGTGKKKEKKSPIATRVKIANNNNQK